MTDNLKHPSNILQEADRIIHGDRNKSYGHPLDNHGTTAGFWRVYLEALAARGVTVGPADVCMLNVLQKVARFVTTGDQKLDTLVDIAGYAGNVEMIWDDEHRRGVAIETFGPLPPVEASGPLPPWRRWKP